MQAALYWVRMSSGSIANVLAQPFLCPVVLTERDQGCSAEVGRPWVFRVKGQFALGPFDASSRSTLFFAVAAEGTIDLNEQADDW